MKPRLLSVGLALAAVAGCRSAPSPPAGASLDLVARFAVAEARSDAVDLPFLLSRPALVHQGWAREGEGRAAVLWLRQSEATLQLPLFSRRDKILVVRARAAGGVAGVDALVSLNGQPLGTVSIGPMASEHELPMPESLQREGDNELRIVAVSAGPRRRPLALEALGTRPAGAPAMGGVPTLEGTRLWIPARSSLSFYVRRKDGNDVRIAIRARGEAGRLLVRAQDAAGVSTTLGDLQARGGDANPHPLSLGAVASDVVRLELASVGTGGVGVDALAQMGPPIAPRPQPARLSGRPNVVVFVADTLRADELGLYGSGRPTSPVLDALAAESITFTRCVAQSSWTRPTVASLFTGLAVDAHGIEGTRNEVVPRLTTLAEALRSSGYATAAFVANPVVDDALGFAQGFDTWVGKNSALENRPADAVVDAALQWASTAREPFFLYVHSLDPHSPYTPPAAHWAPFLFAPYRGPRDPSVLMPRKLLAAEELRFLRSAYDGEVHATDAALGTLVAALRGRGLLDRSILAFTADHGEEFRDHGGGGHGNTLYEEVLHVPLVARLPGASRGGTRDESVVQQVDLAPTLLALTGATPLPDASGRDLSARWLGRGEGEDSPVAVSRLQYAASDKVSARLGAMKLVLNQERKLAGAAVELYDLERDPGEKHNLAAEQPVMAGYLRAEASWQRSVGAALRRRLMAGREVTPTAEQAERLRALGYVQ